MKLTLSLTHPRDSHFTDEETEPRGLRSLEFRPILIQIMQIYFTSSTRALGSPKLPQTQEVSRSCHLASPIQDPVSPCVLRCSPSCAVTQPLYPTWSELFANSSLLTKRGYSGSFTIFFGLYISDSPQPTGPLPRTGHPTLWLRLGSLGALSSSSELPCSSSDDRSSLGAAAEMGQTL